MASFEKYPEYQATKYPWIGDLPKAWNVRRLKEVGRLFGGAGFPHEYQNVQGEELYFYKVGDLSLSENGKTLLASPHTISKETARVLRATIVPKSAIVYAKIGAALLLNRRRMTTEACCIDNNMTAYVTEAKKVIPEWAFYWLSTIDFGEHVNLGAVPSFSEGYQSVLPIPVPPVEEQKVIARFLDFKTAQIDALIAKKKVLLDKLVEKRTALISHAVTKGLDPSVAMKDSGVAWLGEVPSHWTIMRARYASTFVTSGSRGWAEYYSDSGSVFLRITNVSRDSVDLLLHDIQRVLPPKSSEGERTATQSGDVLVSITADLGSVAVIPDGFENAYVSQHLALVRPNGDRIFGRWMAYQFFSACGQAQLTGSGYGGTKIQLGLGDVKDVWLALPPTDEQEEICTWIGAEVDKLKRQSDSIHDLILRLREYRSALVTNAVTGKIDVRGFATPHPAEGIAS